MDGRTLASGPGWTVEDVICSRGPDDRPFEEQHEQVAIAIVTAGTFQYSGSGVSARDEIMAPGSVLLGNPGQYFQCGHEHAVGDRCLSFRYAPSYFERVVAGVGPRGRLRFTRLRLPPLRDLSPLIAQAQVTVDGSTETSWEELAVLLAVRALELDDGSASSREPVTAAAISRVTQVIRAIEGRPDDDLTLDVLAREAKLSPFHFLRTFRDLTGVTPHQYLMRTRLRRAAARLVLDHERILDVALDSGFGDVSNFNRAFRAEFGVSPRAYRHRPSLSVPTE